jgi:hypothetical protein
MIALRMRFRSTKWSELILSGTLMKFLFQPVLLAHPMNEEQGLLRG